MVARNYGSTCRLAMWCGCIAFFAVGASATTALPQGEVVDESEWKVNGKEVTVLLGRFVKWLKENGAMFDKVTPVWTRQTGFELQVVSACKTGETLVQMPISLFLGPKTVEKSWLRTLLDPLPVPERVQVLLMWEDSNATSFFRPYLDMLPRTFDSPLFWTRDQAKELQGTSLLDRSITLRYEMPRSWHELKALVLDKHASLFPPETFTYDKYLWSYSVVRSRAFGNFTLMPLLDLLNHHPMSRLAPTLMADGTGDRLIAQADLGVGEKVWGFYGFKSDSELVGSYGFTSAPLVNNMFNNIELTISMDLDRPSASGLGGLKHILVRAMGLHTEQQSFVVYKGFVPHTLMTLLTIDACDDDLGERVLNAAAQGTLVSLDPRAASYLFSKALARLTSFCHTLLARYPTTLAADLLIFQKLRRGREGLLTEGREREGFLRQGKDENAETFRRMKLALLVRMGEKDVLEALAVAASAIKAQLDDAHELESPQARTQFLWSVSRGELF